MSRDPGLIYISAPALEPHSLEYFFPDGIDPSVSEAGIPAPAPRDMKYGCAAFVRMVLVLPYTKAGFDFPAPVRDRFITGGHCHDNSHFDALIAPTLRASAGDGSKG